MGTRFHQKVAIGSCIYSSDLLSFEMFEAALVAREKACEARNAAFDADIVAFHAKLEGLYCMFACM